MTEHAPVFEIDEAIVKRLRLLALCIAVAIFLLALVQLSVHTFVHDVSIAQMLSSRNLNSVFSVLMLFYTSALAAGLYEDKRPALKYLRLFFAFCAATIAGVQLDKAFFNISQAPLDSFIDLMPENSVWLVRCFLNPGDAVSSILIGLGLLSLNISVKRPAIFLSDCFCIAAILTCLMSLIGWVFGVPHFCLGGIDCQKIAPAIPLTLTCLGVGVLLARPDHGVFSVMASANAGGVLARFWFPAAIGVPLLLGYFRALGQEAKLFDRDTGLTILVLVLIATFYFFILWFARRVDQMDVARQLTSDRLAASERRTRQIVESAIEAYVSIDGNGVIVGWNKEASNLFGWSREEAVGSKLVDKLVPSELTAAYVEKISKFLTSTNSLSMSKRLEAFSVHKDGNVFPIEMAVFPVHWDEGMNYCAFVHDISDRKEAEARVSEFYSIVSHELRTPLTSIKGALGMIDGGTCGDLPPKATRLISLALKNCNRLVRLINDILDIRKIEAGKMELNTQELDVEALLQRVIDDLQPLAATSKVTLIADPSVGGIIRGDHDRVTQILTNLVSNAIKFSSSDGAVIIRTTSGTDKFLRFNVIDEGPGIPANHIHKLFGKFSQLDSSITRKKGGTGLGLAISKALVEQHGGTIGVDSVHTKGSTFWFELPMSVDSITGTRVKLVDQVNLNRVVGVVEGAEMRESASSGE